jgi:sulfatase modifying factor 1
MNCMSWYEASAFCIWDGGRLPTEAEWEYAAAGGDENRLYPWGAAAPTASHANYWAGADSPFVAVGSTPLGDGRWGHADVAGSMYEWTLDWYAADWFTTTQGGCADCANLTTTAHRVVRGCAWGAAAVYLRVANRMSLNGPDVRGRSVGIRCARDP